jgi:hypothetical protein
MQVSGTTKQRPIQEYIQRICFYITTDQPLELLDGFLLEPLSKTLFFRWGFFLSIFQEARYSGLCNGTYGDQMLQEPPEQKRNLNKMASDARFATNPNAILGWFYN